MKLLLTLGVVALALATAGNALAGIGQSTTQSIGTVQIGSADVSPAAAANAPVNVNSGVCVLSDCSSGAATQSGGGSTAATTSNGNGSGAQTVSQSVGTAQVGSANVNPAVSANAPVNGNAPVCVLSNCSGSHAAQQGGSSSSSTQNTGQSQAGDQSASQSIVTAQVGSANVSPSVGANVPVNANAPVCVASDCAGSTATHQGGGATSASSGTSGGGGGGTQSVTQSIGTVQIGSVGVGPSVATNTPVTANAPVCVGSDCSNGGGTGTPVTPAGTAGTAPAAATPSTATPSTATPTAPATGGQVSGATGPTATSGLAGATHTLASPKATAAAGGQLPYSGLDLVYVLAAALSLLIGGGVVTRMHGGLRLT